MSTIWTPGGERPVPPVATAGSDRPAPPEGAEASTRSRPGAPGEPTAEEIAEVQRQIRETPASVVITNHCIGLFQLAALHLDGPKPRFEEAQLAIDALGAVVEGLGARLGEDAQTLKDALAQIRLAFVQVRAASGEVAG
ncbi:MAG: hypothetical protein ACYDAD_05810 [Acidimicrobiales bacterium]